METISNRHDDGCPGEGSLEKIIILLTKPPHSERTKLCFCLIDGSKSNVVLYLVGDGVFNLLSRSIDVLLQDRIFACKEDMDARSVQLEGIAILPDDFYERLVEDVMGEDNKVYAF